MNELSTELKDVESSVPFPKIEDETPKASDKKRSTGGHKRSISGNLFSRLNILRPNDGEKSDTESTERTSSASGRNSMSEALSTKSNRKRKGSLRKVVLGKGRDRKGSEKKSPLSSPKPAPTEVTTPPLPETEDTTDEVETPRPSRELPPPVIPEVPPRWPFRTLSRVSIPSIRSSVASFEPISSAASILTSPTLQTDSTEDDDELQIPKLVAARQVQAARLPLKKPGNAADSYFPIQPGIHAHIRQPSPLSSSSANINSPIVDDDVVSSEEWDYTETAWWGYFILTVTWIVFVVGMGSCFGVWSWAWDVGETPYAPPELEDDPTLPIVGYYPALLVLTCVMAWVWVVVAWVGMKYFRHADLRGDDR
ncbi:hypothetical protein H2198_003708 [Neophaeococcomyces mojaviensis]|uniref:Uncharacterized protein n=1 Tax=Neophaeococcomyces mojaviensis TaxID=3383035 RepID=A0ACC3AAL9_9EURO|nr:hypothetical protein H2198_003708 [Knufia sp. JES_112]